MGKMKKFILIVSYILFNISLFSDTQYIDYLDKIIKISDNYNERLVIIITKKIMNVLVNGINKNNLFILGDDTLEIADSVQNPMLTKSDIEGVCFFYKNNDLKEIYIKLFFYTNDKVQLFIVDQLRDNFILIELYNNNIKYQIGDEEDLFKN